MKEEAEKKGFKLIHKGMGASCERAGSLGLITVRGALHFSKPDRLLVGSTPPDAKSCHNATARTHLWEAPLVWQFHFL